MITRKDVILVWPFGSLKARIGIVLDYGAVSFSQKEESGTILSWDLKESDFTQKNSLIWTFNLCQYCLIQATGQAVIQENEENAILDKFNSLLIHASNLRVLLMCGFNAEKSLLSQIMHSDSLELNLRGHFFTIY